MNQRIAVDYNQPAVLERLALEVIDLARARGAPAAEVGLSSGEGLSVTVRDGACETVEHERDKSLGITIHLDGRKGSATTSDFSGEALRETVDAALAIARAAEPDSYAGLAAPEYLAREIADLDLDHPWDLEAEAAIELALTCERAARGADARLKQSDGCSVNRYRGTRAYANSHGFHAAYRGTRHGVSAVMIAADAAGMQRGYWFSSARDAATLEDAEEIGRIAARRTVAKLGARKIATTRLPVIFENRIAGGLVGHLISAISGGAQYRRASFLLDALGEQVMASGVSIREEPHRPGGLGSAPFDDDGIATFAKTLVDAGRLETYLLSAYAARRLGRAPTGNAGGVHNLVVSHGERTLEAIIAGFDRALLVTDLMGMGVNGVTGDYSRGAAGFLIEGGAIAHPVEEITIAGNLKTMFKDIQEIGADVDPRSSVHVGSIVLGEMAIAGS
ncbi:MAG: metalloprotease PmbA [Gammaproteobacteria bacterium]|nr:metalloprotease PmbA [Gammaproteobacteria bacterium]